MHTYYSMLGRLISGRTPIHKQGYYILCDNDLIRFNTEVPPTIKTIRAEEIVDTLINGCKEIIQSFSHSPNNHDVYAFSLYFDEYKTVYVYMNTIQKLGKTLQNYTDSQNEDIVHSLEYNLGDFSFQYWSRHMGTFGHLLDQMEKFADHPTYERDEDPLHPNDRPIIAFEAGIIDSGYYALALEAVKRLHAEHAFNSLNKTANFAAYVSTGNGYLDTSVVMRKTVPQEILYEMFPELKDQDKQYQEWADQFQHLSVSTALDRLHDTFMNDYYLGIPYSFNRSEIDVFLALEHFGNSLGDECLERLQHLAMMETLESEHFMLIHCYIEALHFSGQLTQVQKKVCAQLSLTFQAKNEDLWDAARILLEISKA